MRKGDSQGLYTSLVIDGNALLDKVKKILWRIHVDPDHTRWSVVGQQLDGGWTVVFWWFVDTAKKSKIPTIKNIQIVAYLKIILLESMFVIFKIPF
ncbi:hypothetical protein MERGE_000605 [Pneumocystis wakefieldiae]|uniref:Uncharacterized protein n=1 Tax=Pneumocystis wakefieldiae TaxID=38082 RepID=A0A899FQM0_9ASCO|nr:hypothetical protein MERGE_000605 [Pneumocystis wakefieldiae]